MWAALVLILLEEGLCSNPLSSIAVEVLQVKGEPNLLDLQC